MRRTHLVVPGGSAAALLGGVLACLLLAPAGSAMPALPAASGSHPAAGDWFTFTYDISLSNGFGNYTGFTDQTNEQYT
jgi:hypothetical protein